MSTGPDTKRGTGRTSGLMLKAIGEALLNPGKPIQFIDHVWPHVDNEMLMRLLCLHAERFDFIHVYEEFGRIYVVSRKGAA